MTFKDRKLNSMTFQALKMKFLNSMACQVSMTCTFYTNPALSIASVKKLGQISLQMNNLRGQAF